MPRNTTFILISLLLSVTRPAVAANFTMDSWSLGIAIFPSSSTPTSDYLTQVADPFAESHSLIVGASSVSGTYDFWPSQGEFLISGAIEADAEGNTVVEADIGGALLITTQSDLVLHYDANWEVTLPVPTMISALSVRVIDPDAQEVLLNTVRGHDTLFDIGTRQLTLSGDLLLPAGRRYYISYYMDVSPLASSSGHFGVATGSFNFLLTPEPCTLTICATPVAFLLRRRRR
ncbi:MAG TPA: hypothetical protein PK093_05090 [Phycisphaerae bacterium]|nr:hypothetical protein [Phycisphaerae bacterium]